MDPEERAPGLAATCDAAGPDGVTAAWRAAWLVAIGVSPYPSVIPPHTPEEVRAWCRVRWAAAEAAGATGEAPAAQAAFWGAAPVATHGTSSLLGEHAFRCHRRGQHRLAEAAVQALADLALGAALEAPEARGREAIGELGRLRSRVRHRGLARRINLALSAAAALRGLDADALQDLVVEDGGLGADGTRTWRAGPHDVYLFLTDDGEVELAIFERASGRALGAQAQVLAAEHFAAFQEARAVQRALADALSTQKSRLEGALEADRPWRLPAWHLVFGAHPLMRHLAQRLVWQLADGRTFMLDGGQPADATGAGLDLSGDDHVRLLHPAAAPAVEVAAWQARIVSRRLVQPFKQAFREVVVLDPADAGARLDGLVVRHRAFVSLLRARGWAGMSGVGPGGWIGRRELPGRRLAALLSLRPSGSQRDAARKLVALGRLGFIEPGEGSTAYARPATQVSAIAYSEAMRDVLLAAMNAGPCGDQDAGAVARRSAALAEIANARAALVTGLLPQLGVDHVARVEGQGVRVTCGGHEFRLDLGTGDITLSPEGRPVDLDGMERADVPLYIPHEGADAASRAVLANLVWLAKFGRACADKLL